MWWWSAAVPPARWRRGGWPTPGSRSRWSRTTSSAASARSTPACPRRRCCAPRRSCARSTASRAPREAVTGELDVQAVLDRRDEVIHDLDDSSMLPWLEDRGIKLFRGFGVLAGEKRVDVADHQLEARRAVILAGGTRAALPPIEGLGEAEPWTNREATTAKEIPGTIVILGGGVFGTELAQAYRSLGADVTLIEGERRLLPTEEEFACEQVTDALVEMGVDVRTGRKATKVDRGDDTLRVTMDDGSTADGERARRRARPPAAHGGAGARDRRARGRRLRRGRREHAGAGPRLAVRDRRRQRPHPAHPHGQVPGAPRLRAHPRQPRPRPSTAPTASSPRASSSPTRRSPSVGHTEKTAREAGLDVHILEVGTSANAGGSFYGRNAPGTSRLLVDKETDLIVGATITGAEVADFLQAATIAIVGEVPMGRAVARHAVLPHPQRDLAQPDGGVGEGEGLGREQLDPVAPRVAGEEAPAARDAVVPLDRRARRRQRAGEASSAASESTRRPGPCARARSPPPRRRAAPARRRRTRPRRRPAGRASAAPEPQQLAVEAPRLALAPRRRGDLHVVETVDAGHYAK